MSLQTETLFSSALAAYKGGQLKISEDLLLRISVLEPDNIAAKELLAYICSKNGDIDRAEQLLIEVTNDSKAPLSALYECGAHLLHISPERAVNLLERALHIAPNSFEVLHDLGTAYALVGKKKEAIEKYSKAAKINASSETLFYNLGRLHDELLDTEKANACYQESLKLDPNFNSARINLALNLNRKSKFNESLALLTDALLLEPNADFIFGNLFHTQMQMGLWKDFDRNLAKVADGVRRGSRVIHPFHLMSLIDDPCLQQSASKIYAASRPQSSDVTATLIQRDDVSNQNFKIRVGYFSSDFQNHPIAHLTSELFELHDPNLFEIYAFSSGGKSEDKARLRLEKAFHEFIDITDMSDDDVIKLAKSKGITIAVDLGGYTENARIAVFEKRVAPIQVSYLGYIGTLGVSYMDYILADREVIPKESQQFFTEKVVYLPSCFQINDRQREISGKKFNRSDFGLPEEGFIFCCFNHGYKITPVIFESWCRILQRVDGSVLWLYESNSSLSQNLRSEAKNFGINPDRLVFGKALPAPEYLARYRLADLFLDTFPYNAGTTASDALWAGLPILTRAGRSFSSRMASSILKAIDIPELIAKTSDEYESLAIDLASNKDKLRRIREKLVANRNSSPLFNAPQTTKEIEKSYFRMYKIFIEGKVPENIDLTKPEKLS